MFDWTKSEVGSECIKPWTGGKVFVVATRVRKGRQGKERKGSKKGK